MKKVILYLIIGVTCSSFAKAKGSKLSQDDLECWSGETQDSSLIIHQKLDVEHNLLVNFNPSAFDFSDFEVRSETELNNLFVWKEYTKRLQKLELSGFDLDITRPFIGALESWGSLTELHMSYTELDDWKLSLVLDAISQANNLKVLVLNSNKIKGVKVFYNIHEMFPNLKTLNLANNPITEENKAILNSLIGSKLHLIFDKKMIA
jgi:hypothetical protein